MDNMTKKNNTTENNGFYGFINSRKSSILSTFSMNSKTPTIEEKNKNKSIDYVNASRSVDQNEFIFKSNGNYTVNSIGESESEMRCSFL